jgi:hypothetical protein
MNGFQNFMSRFMPQQNQPQAPGVPPRVDGAKRVPKRGGWQDKAYIIGAGLQDMGGGQGNLDAAAAMFGKRDAQAQAMEERQRLVEQARAVITDPREWAVFQADPEAWAKETATRYGAANVAGGDSRLYGDPAAGGSVYTAPKMGFEGDQAVSYDPNGLRIIGTRNPSYQEQTARMTAEQPMSVGDGTDLYDPRENRVIYRNEKNFSPPRVGGAGSSAASGASSALTAIEAELRRRGLRP